MVREKTINILLCLGTLLLLFLIGEIVIRFCHQPISVDRELGWRATENYVIEKRLKDAAGKEYQLSFYTDRHGFRLFGNPHSKKLKILVLGDSFTHAVEVSNNKTYYGIMASRLKNIEFFAYGCRGFGTLQEYMILDKYFDIIKPDIIILQFYSNDLVDNDFELNQQCYFFNNGVRRPYMDQEGRIAYRNPKPPWFFFIPELLLEKSRFAAFVFDKFNRLINYYLKRQGKSVDTIIVHTGTEHPGLRRSARVTKLILDRIKNRAQGAAIFCFCVDWGQPFLNEFKKLAALEGFVFIDGVAEAVYSYEKRGYNTLAAGGHWNELAHRIAGEKITDYLLQHGTLGKSAYSGAPPLSDRQKKRVLLRN
jgi:hypothetical protein